MFYYMCYYVFGIVKIIYFLDKKEVTLKRLNIFFAAQFNYILL